LQCLARAFRYNHIEELQSIVAARRDELAAIVMEPIRDQQPLPGFFAQVRAIASEIGAVLIIDEITGGWRQNTGGAHLVYGLEPDIAVFAKAMSNGYAMAAVVGRSEVMQAAQRSFISSTYWTERIGPAAALATIRKHRRCNVAQHLLQLGKVVQEGWKVAAERAGLPIEVGGIPGLGHFVFEHADRQAMRTLYTQLMLERGFLASGSFYLTYAHTREQVEAYLEATEEAFKTVATAVAENRVLASLKGPVAHTGFRRLT